MSSQTPSSKSQQRAASLLGVTIDADDYTAAGAALEAAGIPASGLPAGHTWRSAGKLGDAELLAALGASPATETASANLAARQEQVGKRSRRAEHLLWLRAHRGERAEAPAATWEEDEMFAPATRPTRASEMPAGFE